MLNFDRPRILLATIMSATLLALPVPAYAGMPVTSVDPSQPVPSLAPILKNVMPAVVNISVRAKVKMDVPPIMKDPMFRRFFGDQFPGMQDGSPQEKEVQGAGSGVIVDATKGYVLTNNHVIDKADEIFVVLKDKRQLKAEVVGRDEEGDIAVLKIKADNLVALPIGHSDQLQVGDYVLAIGNPFGLGHTVTSGIVSALGRSGLGIENYENFIQTDASINPGNSGGALINLRGELVGINTAIVSGGSGGNVGIGFAIPIDMATGTMNELITNGKVERGQLGIQIQDVTPELADALGITANQGAVVAHVQAGSPAEKAGVKDGDVVTGFNGKAVESAGDLKNKVGLLHIGDTVTIDVLRKGTKKTLTAQIGKRPANVKTAGKGSGDQSGVTSDHELLKGVMFSDVPEDVKSSNVTAGVYVADVDGDSAAARAGLQPGDIVVSCNQVDVKTPDELFKAAALNKRAVLLNVRREDGALFLVIRK